MTSGPAVPTTVLGAPEIGRALTRIAHEVLERNKGADDLVLLGIPTRGLPLAERLARLLAAVERHAPVAEAELVGLAPAAAFAGWPEEVRIRGRRTVEAALDAVQ